MHYGMDDAYPIDDLDEILPGLLEGRTRVYYHFGRDTDFDLKLIGWLNRVRAQVRQGAQPPHEFLELGHLLDEMRLFKSRDELKLMRKAADISVLAHEAAMRAAKPGVHEYELQAEIERVFRTHDALSGLRQHRRRRRQRLRAALHRQQRAGAGWRPGAGRCRRRISRLCVRHHPHVPGQRPLQQGTARAARPGRCGAGRGAGAGAGRASPYEAGHDAAVATLTEGLLKLGLLKGKLEKNIADGGYKRFYRHKTGHWLGLDVHDVGDYRIDGESRLLEPGMVFTIEPGLYMAPGDKSVPAKWRGIGIRTEDDVVVTKDGHEVLTAELARSADEIEAFMGERTR